MKYLLLMLGLAFTSLTVLSQEMKLAPLDRYLLFGGPDNLQFLGCIDCRPANATSIRNEQGNYGSLTGEHSIMNPHSIFANPDSDFSICNPSSSNPPILVDQDGVRFGSLTMNMDIDDRLAGGMFELILKEACPTD